MGNLSSFVKYQRKKLGFTQEELALKAGVGLRFIREMEQGKETLQMDKVNQVLSLLGFELRPDVIKIDPYEIIYKYENKAIKLTLRNRIVKYGFIIDHIDDPQENKITGWKFVPNKNAIEYQKKENENLIETIDHKEILLIEKQ